LAIKYCYLRQLPIKIPIIDVVDIVNTFNVFNM